MPSSSTGTLATVVAACSVTAAVTFYLTAAAAKRTVLAEKKMKYERDLQLKEKTIAARKLANEPSGVVIDDVSLDRVFLWEIEDLKKRFSPCNIENVMRNVASTTTNPYYFPSVKKSASSDSIAELSDGKPTHFNKLITNHECILGNIVRKPNQQPYTHAYVRAGPRRLLHFDPAKVNAAIVTCGGTFLTCLDLTQNANVKQVSMPDITSLLVFVTPCLSRSLSRIEQCYSRNRKHSQPNVRDWWKDFRHSRRIQWLP